MSDLGTAWDLADAGYPDMCWLLQLSWPYPLCITRAATTGKGNIEPRLTMDKALGECPEIGAVMHRVPNIASDSPLAPRSCVGSFRGSWSFVPSFALSSCIFGPPPQIHSHFGCPSGTLRSGPGHVQEGTTKAQGVSQVVLQVPTGPCGALHTVRLALSVL